MATKQDQAQSAMRDMLSKGKQTPQSSTDSEGEYRSIGVGLTATEQAKIDAIAAELGQNRHAVLKYAVLDFIKRYEAGERPETTVVTKEVLKP